LTSAELCELINVHPQRAVHGTDAFPTCCPDISRATASDIANLATRS
jgi:hypothetical protein